MSGARGEVGVEEEEVKVELMGGSGSGDDDDGGETGGIAAASSGGGAAVTASLVAGDLDTDVARRGPIPRAGEDDATVARVRIAHGGHVGVLQDDGRLVCHVEEPGLGADGSIEPTRRQLEHACALTDADVTSVSGVAAHEHEDGDEHHMHGPGCGHALVPHRDHTDFLVGDELHHQNDETCELHGRVRLLAGTDVSYDTGDALSVGASSVFARSKFAVYAHTAMDNVLRRNNAANVSARRQLQSVTTLDNTEEVGDVLERGDLAAPSAKKKPGCCGGADARRFVMMSFLTGGFFFVELIYGFAIGSLALQADAFHMASDLIALFVGFYSLRAAQREATVFATYGWTRMEIVGALLNGVFLLATCFNITLEALHRLQDIHEVVESLDGNGEDLTIVAVLGLVVNVLGLFIFGHGHGGEGGHGHSHGGGGHGHSHGGGMNANIKGVLLHVLGDALGSVGVIISGLVIQHGESWGDGRFYADPLCSLAIVIIIAVGTIPLVRRCITTLLQHSPPGVDMHLLRSELLAVDGVLDVHELHVWELNNSVLVASAHVTCSNKINWMKASDEMKLLLHRHGVHNTTLQPEFVITSEFEKLGPHVEMCFEPVCGDSCVEASCCDLKALHPGATPRSGAGLGAAGHSHGHGGHGHTHGGHGHSHGGH